MSGIGRRLGRSGRVRRRPPAASRQCRKINDASNLGLVWRRQAWLGRLRLRDSES